MSTGGVAGGRGALPELASAHPLAHALPALYRDDDFLLRFLAGLDRVLAPVLATLDNLHTYLDPRIAPEDFVAWLAGWLDVDLREDWSSARCRRVVAEAVVLYRWEGTVSGLRDLAATHTDGEVEVEDSGGVAWSASPRGPLPGEAEPRVTVRVQGEGAGPVDADWLQRLLTAAAPAHVAVTVEVEGG